MTRFSAVGWAVWVDIASASVVVVGVGGVMSAMVIRRGGMPGRLVCRSGFGGEVSVSGCAAWGGRRWVGGNARAQGGESGKDRVEWFVWRDGGAEEAEELRRRRIRAVSVPGLRGEGTARIS